MSAIQYVNESVLPLYTQFVAHTPGSYGDVYCVMWRATTQTQTAEYEEDVVADADDMVMWVRCSCGHW